MTTTALWSYMSAAFLTAVALVSLRKDWKDYQRLERRALLVFIFLAGVVSCFITFSTQRDSAASEKRIVQLQQTVNTEQQNNSRNYARYQQSFDGLNERLMDLQTKVKTAELQKDLQETKAELLATRKALEPAAKAKLLFSFFTTDPKLVPIRETTLPLVLGSVTVPFIVVNNGAADAIDGDFNIQICDACTFAQDTQGICAPFRRTGDDKGVSVPVHFPLDGIN